MKQPKKDEITQKLKSVINQEIDRDEVADWAMDYIINDDKVIIEDIEAWHYLVAVSGIDTIAGPGKYLYMDEDFSNWIMEYDKK